MTQSDTKKSLVVIGSTGSIGTQTLDVADRAGGFDVVGLGIRKNISSLFDQVDRFAPQAVGVASLKAAAGIVMPGRKMFSGPDAASQLLDFTQPDVAMIASAGMESLPLAVQALNQGALVLMATKEPMCVVGDLLAQRETSGKGMIPVDSELTGLHSLLSMVKPEAVRTLLLCASGGPFRKLSFEDLAHVTPKQALNHPRWNMGAKVTIDSATLINKAIELTAAARVFGFDPGHVDAYLHPEAYAHAFIELTDATLLSVSSENDMRVSIARALVGDTSVDLELPRLNIPQSTFHFQPIEGWQRRVLDLASVAAVHRRAALAMIAADEVAVAAFLDGLCPLSGIIEVVETMVDRHAAKADIELPADDCVTPIMADYQRLIEESQALIEAL